LYLEHYGLSRKPFAKTPDPAFLFPSERHAEALARLSHAVDEREVAVLTGEIGAGKTLLTRALVEAFADRCRFSFVIHPALPPAQLLAAVADGFGLSAPRRKADVFTSLARHVAKVDGEGRFAVVVIDEAQLLPAGAFDELRLLTNVCADDRALLGLLLVGQPELRERVTERGGAAFAQRVGVAYHLGPLRAEETARYVEHRLAVAGRSERLFTGEGLAALHRLSGGIPRLVNQYAASALLEGFARDCELLSEDVVEAAAADLAAHLGLTVRAR